MLAALEAGAVRQRPWANMFKPRPFRFEADFLASHNCTACKQEAKWFEAVQATSIGASKPNLFVDEAAIASWQGIVIEMELPRKKVLRWQRDDVPLPPRTTRRSEHGGFGVPGTLLYDSTRQRWRAWREAGAVLLSLSLLL